MSSQIQSTVTSAARGCRRALQSDRGNVYTGHLPTRPGKPDGVTALAAADIQHAARVLAAQLRDEHAVGPPTP